MPWTVQESFPDFSAPSGLFQRPEGTGQRQCVAPATGCRSDAGRSPLLRSGGGADIPETMKEDAQLTPLGRLLDDPSPVVRRAVLERLREAGAEGVTWLEARLADQEHSAHAKALLEALRTPESAARAFLRYVATEGAELERACLLLERAADPSLADDAHSAEFDRLAARVKELLAEPLDMHDRCRLLCRVVFGEEGYRGARESMSSPASSLLSRVIASRRGIPISLCLLCLFTARRLGLPLEPVGLPGRFMLGMFTGPETFYVDCFEGGTFRSRAEVQLMLLDNHLPADDAFLGPVTARQTLARCCRNLTSQCEAAGDDGLSRMYQGFAQKLEEPA
jgi:regulator of sirC expression with transglutaminase-like and TPR domain